MVHFRNFFQRQNSIGGRDIAFFDASFHFEKAVIPVIATVIMQVPEMHLFTGRKLNFLLQEQVREANTIASKSQHAEISQKIVQIKEELEKIREQLQNIE